MPTPVSSYFNRSINYFPALLAIHFVITVKKAQSSQVCSLSYNVTIVTIQFKTPAKEETNTHKFPIHVQVILHLS